MTRTDRRHAAGPRRRRRRSRARRSARSGTTRRGRHRRGACSTPRCRATRRSSPTRRYAGQIITFTYPHIGNYGVNADDDESRRPVLPRASSCATWPRRPSNWRADASRSTTCLAPPRRARHHRHRHPPPHPSPARRTARCPARSAPTRRAVRGRGGRERARPTASTSSPTRHHRRALHRRATTTRRSASSPTTSASSARSCATSSASGCRVEVVPARTPAADVLAREPDGVFLSNGPGDPAAVAGATDDGRAALVGRGAGVRHLPRSPDPRPRARRRAPSSCRSVTTAATTRCATMPTGRVEITSQNHNYAVDADSLDRAASRSPT